MIEAHKLQKDTVSLLDALYKDDHLAVTPAMLSIRNGYYPDINNILSTLNYYKDIERVKAFIDDNAELIEKAKKDLDDEKAKHSSTTESTEKENIFSGIFNKAKSPTLFEKLKSVSFKELEDSLSEVLSNKLDDEIMVSIDDINHSGNSFPENVSINIVLSKSKF